MPQIHFNGKTYNDIAEMPAMERQAYEQLMSIFKDEDQDGIPDIFQGDVVSNIINVATTEYVVDGRQVSGSGEMTPGQRARLEKGLSKLQELGFISQVPDLPKREQASPSRTMPTWEDAEIRPSKPIIPSTSVIREDSGPRWILVLVVLAVLVVCGIGAVLFYLM